MIEEVGARWRVYSLRSAAAGLRITLDTRQETLTFALDPQGEDSSTGARLSLSIRCGRFPRFESDLSRIAPYLLETGMGALPAPRYQALMSRLKELAESREPPPAGLWHEALGKFAFLLLRFGLDRPEEQAVLIAKKLLRWVGASGAKTAWFVSYDEELSYEHRSRFLRDARRAFAGGDAAGGGSALPDLSDVNEREAFWWTTRRGFELDLDWYRSEGYHSPDARRALHESGTAYLQLLKDEPRRHDLARFLEECGTDVEREVNLVLFPPGEVRSPRRHPGRVVRAWRKIRGAARWVVYGVSRPSRDGSVVDLIDDEVVRRTFFVWFLKRYDLWSASKLIHATAPAGESVMGARLSLLVLNALALFLFLFQLSPAFERMYPALTHGEVEQFWIKPITFWLWLVQALLQLGSLALALLFAPTYFRLLMPRALFGSLLAWTTIILTSLLDLRGVVTPDFSFEKMCREMHIEWLVYGTFIGSTILLLSSVFTAYTISQFVHRRGELVKRTLLTSLGLIMGSLFWGGIFSLPAKFVLESTDHSGVFMFECFGMLPVITVGVPVAVLFGLIVQLIWEDASITEPLGEPL